MGPKKLKLNILKDGKKLIKHFQKIKGNGGILIFFRSK